MKVLLIFSALMVISCVENRKAGTVTESEDSDLFVFDFKGNWEKSPQMATLNELIDSIYYVPLETHKDALLPERYNFAKIGGDMFVGGGRLPEPTPIYQFDSLGRFVKQVTYHGRGPNEILMTMSWYANSNLKHINVVSTGSYMVLISTESGERHTIKFNERQGFAKIPLNDSSFVSSQNLLRLDTPQTSLYFIDRTGDLVHEKKRERVYGRSRPHTRVAEGAWTGPYEGYWLVPDYKGDAIFHNIFNDTLYRIKNCNEITPHLVFKRGILSPDPKDVDDQDNRERQVYFASLKESDDHVFLNYHHDGKMWCSVWSKYDGSLLINSEKKRSGPFADIYLPFALPDGELIELQVVYADLDNVYCIMEALNAYKFLPGIKEDDNPVIVIAKLKK